MPEPRIIVLSETVASKIAAGEVIERPASVVKELVENSIDAGAQSVEVDVEEGGRRLIRVKDDGCGMTTQEAVVSLQRHATSKIRTADDLFSVSSLGFRGEALPSIAVVSHFTMLTRSAEDVVGAQLTSRGGTVEELEEIAAPVGTTISVSGLFYNTPARLKFMRSQATEFAHIAELINRFSLSHHHISFLLKHNGREVLRRPAGLDLREPLAQMLGRDNAAKMLEVSFSSPLLEVKGFISPVEMSRASRSQQYFFVNRRWIRSRSFTRALEDCYHTLLPIKRFPIAALLVTIDPTLVDVNVHPTKAEVRFSREGEIFQLLRRAVREAMAAAGIEAAPLGAPAAGVTPLSAAPNYGLSLGLPQQPPAGNAPKPPSEAVSSKAQLHPALQPRPAGANAVFRPLAQLRETYILAEGESGLMVVDQHRAHERVLYEEFMQEAESRKNHSQPLLAPATVQLRPREASALAENLPSLRDVGFDLEEFGTDAFLVRAVPVVFLKKEPVRLLTEIAEDLTTSPQSQIHSRREKALISMSCKAAVKAGDILTTEEMDRLLAALSATSRPYTCPHGRPTVMTISNFELDRKFHR